jgi:mono/diheme cytochrome c family protein
MAAAGATVAAALAATGCGSGGHHSLNLPRKPARAELTAGARIFESSCANCHTLSGHDTSATGGDLALLPASQAEIASFARIMPVEPPLTPTRVKAVAAYIVGMERRR